MQEAIRQALAAKQAGDYPNGAVLVIGDEIVSAKENRVKRDESSIAHAEVLAILDASQKLKSRHLINAILYTTHEPCPLCAASSVFARLKGIVYGASNEDMKQFAEKNPDSAHRPRIIDISCEEIIKQSHADIEIVKDFMRSACVALLEEIPTEHIPADETDVKL